MITQVEALPLTPSNVGYGSHASDADAALLFSAKRGDKAAFAALYDRHSERMRRLALRIVRNPQDAEDAVQDAMLSAFVNLSRFDERSSFGTWVRRICINEGLMQLRKVRRHREVSTTSPDEDTPDFEACDTRPLPDQMLAADEKTEMLRRALRRLPASLRMVMECRMTRECSISEIASTLNISVQAVKTRLFRAKKLMREQIVSESNRRPAKVHTASAQAERPRPS